MKKITAAALALLLLLSFPVAAFADGTTTLTTTVPGATYTLNIPADQNITYGTYSTDIGNVTVTDGTNFAKGKNIQLTVSFGEFTCDDTDTTIPFSLVAKTSDGTMYNVLSSGTKALVFNGKSDGSIATNAMWTAGSGSSYNTYDVGSFYVEIWSTDWGKAEAGDYSATITFTSEIVNS